MSGRLERFAAGARRRAEAMRAEARSAAGARSPATAERLAGAPPSTGPLPATATGPPAARTSRDPGPAVRGASLAGPRPARGPDRFPAALAGRDRVCVVAEIKRRSPSRGVLVPALDVAARARAYAHGGAAAISVLTEPEHFGGSLDDLRAVAEAVEVPVLMKDFVVDPIQIERGAAAGAAAVLLIARLLSPDRLGELVAAADGCGVAALVECRDALELEHALHHGGVLVGVNNRDLETLVVEPSRAVRLLAGVPPGRVTVAESGYATRAQLETLAGIADAALVGTSLMTADDVGAHLRGLLG